MTAKLVWNNLDFQGQLTNQNLAAPINPTDAARLVDITSKLEGLAWKDEVVAATTAPISMAAPGTIIDTVVLAANDRILVKDNANPAENGVYIWTAFNAPLVRAPDATTTGALNNAVVPITGGSQAGSNFRQSTINPVVDTDALAFIPFGVAAPTVAAATEAVAGIAARASQAEVDAGFEDTKYVSSSKLKNAAYLPKKASGTFAADGVQLSYTVSHNLNGTILSLPQMELRNAIGEHLDVAWNYQNVNTAAFQTDIPLPAANYHWSAVG